MRLWMRSSVLSFVLAQDAAIEGGTRTKNNKKMIVTLNGRSGIEEIAVMRPGGEDDELARIDWSGME